MKQDFPLKKITPQDLEQLEDWEVIQEAIAKTFSFSSFKAAIEFVNSVAVMAEKQNHHPEISIDFNKVSLTLTTKDSGGITQKDFVLAKEIDTLSKK